MRMIIWSWQESLHLRKLERRFGKRLVLKPPAPMVSKRYLDTVGASLSSFFPDFFKEKSLKDEASFTHVVHILKCEWVNFFDNLRSISLCSFSFEVINRNITMHLRKVLDINRLLHRGDRLRKISYLRERCWQK